MKVLIIIIAIFITGGYSQLCNVKCLPENEFPRPANENDIPVTREWSRLMSLLNEKTFRSTPYTKICTGGNEVVIDHNSKIIWDLRSTIYNERQGTSDKTIKNCYCHENNCGASFQICMRDARNAMVDDINAIWDVKIETALADLCNLSTIAF